MNNTTELAREAAILSAASGAVRLWLGLNAAGHVAQFWLRRPVAHAHAGLHLVEYVCTPAAPAAAPAPESQPARLTQAQIDQIAEGWDGCMYDAPGEFIDIGASLRRALAALAAPVSAAHEQEAK